MLWLGIALVLVISGCRGPSDDATPEKETGTSPDAAIAEFVADWQAGRDHDAAALTADPQASALLMTSATRGLHATELAITTGPASVDDDEASVTATLTWQMPVVGEWTYDVVWHWQRRTSGESERWLLDFGPSAIHPQLGASQSLAVQSLPARDGPIVDRNDTQLISPVRVYSVVLLLDKVPNLAGAVAALVEALAPIDPQVTADSITDGVRRARSAGESSYTVLNIRDTDFAPVEAALTSIAGVTLPSEVRNLPPTPGFASLLLRSALPIAVEQTAGQSGWRIITVDMAGDALEAVAEQPATPGAKVTFTLDPAIQNAAQAAIDPIAEQAMLVALEPATGEILAVAQNAAADAEGPMSLMGRYPPGSIFKIVTATAAIDAGLITPDSEVQCPGSWSYDGKMIRNDGFALGRVTGTQAFAHSCNTTFAELATQLPESALPDTALQYGIGVDFEIAGITTLTGAIQVAPTVLAKAQNGFGQGTDLVTPFGAALMAATAATGDMPVPTLIRGMTTTVDRPIPERSTDAQAGIRQMMRAVVTDGTARSLRDAGEVYAKTGTAEFVTPDGEVEAHAWTVGFRGDVAFSILIVGGNSSKRTNDIAHTFLTALPADEAAS